MIKLENLSFGYDADHLILRDISLSVQAGERVCLLGLNGSGKSTLLKLCAGLLKPSAGRLTVGGSGENDSRVGFIFQNPDDQIVGSTVAEDIAFALQNLQVQRDEIASRVERSANDFSLLDKHRAAPEELSAGEKQRLALAGVLVTKPSLLLIDEPTSYLDTAGKAQLRSLVQSTPATVIAASQFVDEIDDFDRVLFLEEGALVFDGTPTEFRSSEFMPSSLAVSSSATPSDGKVLLEARNLEFSYDNLTVVSDFSHQFKSGRVTAIMGPSGSGKTTLALLLAGLLKPQQGDVVSNAKTRIGVLLQFPEHNFFAETVFDEVAFAARNQGLAEEEVLQRVTGALTQVGLNYEEFYRRNPFTLSAGEQRRVAIAAVLVMDCSVYIFDEITCGLDWEGRQLVAGMLASLASAGKCLILCGHDRELAEALGAEVVEMGRAV